MIKKLLKELKPKSFTDWVILATAAVWIMYAIFK
jgi:hypothetical protein